MTMRYIVTTILSLGMFLAGSSPVDAADHPLRVTLEASWKDFVAASKSGKESELEKTMSSFYFATLRNNLARSGRAMTPENLRSVSRLALDSGSTNFVTVLENGPTAGLVHMRDADQTDASRKPRVEYFFVKFVNEGQGWKVDGSTSFQVLKYQDDGKPAPFNPARLAQGLQVDGRIRKAPAASTGIAPESQRSAQRLPKAPVPGSQPSRPPSSGAAGGTAQDDYRACMQANAATWKLRRASEELVRTVSKMKQDGGKGKNQDQYQSQLKRQWDHYQALGGTAVSPEQVSVPEDPCKPIQDSMRQQADGARKRYNECATSRANEVKLANLSGALVQGQKRLAAAEALQAEKPRNPDKPADTKGPGERARQSSVEPAQLRAGLERTFQEYRKSGGPATTIENVKALPNPCLKELEAARAGPPGPSPVKDTRKQTAPGQVPDR